MLNWDILPGMIKCGRVRCIGHGDHLDGEDCRMWTVIEVDGQKVLVLEQWRNGELKTLNDESLTRISHLLNIYKLLLILFSPEDRACQWPHKPNAAPPFNGQSALAYMLDNQLSGITAVHHHLQSYA